MDISVKGEISVATGKTYVPKGKTIHTAFHKRSRVNIPHSRYQILDLVRTTISIMH